MSRPGPNPSDQPRDERSRPIARRTMMELDPPLGQTLVIECPDDDFPEPIEALDFPDTDEMMVLSKAAIETAAEALMDWYDVAEGSKVEYLRSLWTAEDERAGGTLLVIILTIQPYGRFGVMVAPPGSDPEESTTMIWVGPIPDEEEDDDEASDNDADNQT